MDKENETETARYKREEKHTHERTRKMAKGSKLMIDLIITISWSYHNAIISSIYLTLKKKYIL